MFNIFLIMALMGIISSALGSEYRYPISKQKTLIKRKADNSSKTSDIYTIEFEVGSKQQKINAVMDTSSSDFWILGNNSCELYLETLKGTKSLNKTLNNTIMDICKSGTFNPIDSTTFKKIYLDNVFYAKSARDYSFAAGFWGADNINVGDVTLENATFGVASIANTTSRCGLGFRNFESSNTNFELTKNRTLNISGVEVNKNTTKAFEYDNFPYLLKAQKIIKRVAYSLFLNTETKNGSSILFGAVDKSQFSGKLTTVPILRNSSFNFINKTKVDNFVISILGVGYVNEKGKGTTFNTQTQAALIDTSYSGVTLPREIAEGIARTFNATFNKDTNNFKLKCPKSDENGHCLLDITFNKDNSTILGNAFLKSLYVLFDLESYEMSFGQANLDSKPKSIVTLPATGTTFAEATKAHKYSSIWTSSPKSYTSGGNLFHNSKTVSNPYLTTTQKTTSTKANKDRQEDNTSKSKNSATILSIGLMKILLSVLI
ncbi:unnamed protein product [Hanseniaspora opuntiae]